MIYAVTLFAIMFAMPIVTRPRNHYEFTSLELNKVGRKVLLFLKAELSMSNYLYIS